MAILCTFNREDNTFSLKFHFIYTYPYSTWGGGGGADSALLQILLFITSVRDAAEPRNLETFPKI